MGLSDSVRVYMGFRKGLRVYMGLSKSVYMDLCEGVRVSIWVCVRV